MLIVVPSDSFSPLGASHGLCETRTVLEALPKGPLVLVVVVVHDGAAALLQPVPPLAHVYASLAVESADAYTRE